MQTLWTFDGCPSNEQAQLELVWRQTRELADSDTRKLLDGPGELRLAVQHGNGSLPWNVSAAWHSSGCTRTAQAAAERAETALSEVAGSLSAAADDPRAAGSDATRWRQELSTLEPLLGRFRTNGFSAAFFSFLRPLLRYLEGYARHELRIFELDGRIPRAQLRPSEILDEALIVAWERYASRPHDRPFDLWLIQLIDEILDAYARGAMHESLESRQPAPSEEPHSSRDDSWLFNADEPEWVELAELLPGRAGIDAWDRLDIETKQAGLDRLLSQLPREQRQALVLNAAEGYDPAEIADLQDRSVDEVTSSINAARQTLWHQFSVEDYVSEIEGELDTRERRDPRRRRR